MPKSKSIHFFDSVVKMPMMSLPVRSVVVGVGQGHVLLSPGSQLTEADYLAMPQVTDIVATSLFHGAGVKKAQAHFKNAKTWYPPGLQEKIKDVRWDCQLGETHWPYESELALIKIEGMPAVNEHVFIHVDSRKLFVTDLCFNLVKTRGLGAWLILSLFGTYKKFAVSRFFAKFIIDRNAFVSSMQRILQLDILEIVVSHGEVVVNNAKEKLRTALEERKLYG